MRKGKVELKKIDDKTSRQVCFSKRRNGLFKKAEELSILCDVDVALFVLSTTGKLYQFPSGNSLTKILERYRSHVDAESFSTRMIRTENCPENATLWKCNNTLQAVQRYLEGSNVNQMNITDIVQLEHLLDSTLKQTRKRKTHLMSDTIQAHQKETHLMTDTIQAHQKEASQGLSCKLCKAYETKSTATLRRRQIRAEEEKEEEEEDKEEEEEEENNGKKKKKQQQTSSNSKRHRLLQEAMLSLA